MDGGSAYGIGNTMHVVGIATMEFMLLLLFCNGIYDNVGDVVKLLVLNLKVIVDIIMYSELVRYMSGW